MAEQIEPGLYKAEWTEEERKELYSLSDTEIDEVMSISSVETAKFTQDVDDEDTESNEDSD